MFKIKCLKTDNKSLWHWSGNQQGGKRRSSTRNVDFCDVYVLDPIEMMNAVRKNLELALTLTNGISNPKE